MKKIVTIIAEKPSQAKEYANAYKIIKKTKHYIQIGTDDVLPNGAFITWGIGHLVELQPPAYYNEKYKKWDLNNLPIAPDFFSYTVTADKKKHFYEVKNLLQKTDEIIIATDIDREGEAIARLIIMQAKANDKRIKRLWINSLEADEIRNGMKNLRDGKETYNFFMEAQARQISDWLIGMNLSPLYTLLLQKKGFSGTLGIGRVQSPTVYMIYQRQQEIENFVSKPFYELFGEFKVNNGIYKGKAKLKEENKQSLIKFLEKNNLAGLVFENGIIKNVKKELKRTKSPRLHSLSTLQTTANKRWKYSPAKVLELMQSLYEKKLVTYPRTDCNYITDSEFEYLSNNVEKYQKIIGVSFMPDKTPKKRYVDSSKVQEHYAIVMTKTIPSNETLKALNAEEKNIYEEIIKITLSMFHNDYEYEETNIITEVNSIEFYTKGKIEINKGWKELFNNKIDNVEKSDETDQLPSVKEGESTNGILEIKEGFTSPPKPYTEGDLINLMKTAGKIVDDESESEILKEVEGIGTEATRAGIIETIKKNGYIEIKKNIVSVTAKGKILCEAIEGSLLSSPSMTAKWESYLKKIGKGQATQEQFIKQTIIFINKQIKEVPGTLSDKIISKKNQIQQKERYLSVCPICKKGNIIEKKNLYGCTKYKNGCNFNIPKRILGKNISVSTVEQLFKGKTNLIKGFKSNKGKKFDAYLKWDNQQNKITFEFPQKKVFKNK